MVLVGNSSSSSLSPPAPLPLALDDEPLSPVSAIPAPIPPPRGVRSISRVALSTVLTYTSHAAGMWARSTERISIG